MNKINRNKRRNANGHSKRRSSHASKKNQKSTLDYNQLINTQARTSRKSVFVAKHDYADLHLHPLLKKNLARKGYTKPTEIQELSLDILVNGNNIVGVANTGTGKTGAFLIPIIENLLTNERPFQSLVVVPTRELAQQVEAEFRSLTSGMNLRTVCLIGGTSVQRDLDRLRQNHNVIVGTPGRLMDMYKQGALRLQDISVLVLDEFDRMLDMGFVHEVRKMVAAMKNRSQTMLFSATKDKSQRGII